MKTNFLTLIALLGATVAGSAQDGVERNAPGKSAFTVTERGAHHKVWERFEDEVGPDGKPFPRKRSYTELATGLHFKNELGEWEESKEEIEILPDNAGAIARKGQHKAIFPPEIKSGLIELQTPEQKWIRSRVWGLAYFDSSSGESVLLAEVQESEGRVISDNVVLYPNAFTDFAADIRYTYMKAGLEQDVVLRENPPAPQEFGLNPQTTRLQVLTEFVESPQPRKYTRKAGKLADEALGFGKMRIGAGKAFTTDENGKRANHLPVAKQWGQLEGRDFLVEEVPYDKVVGQLQKLSPAGKYKGASLQRRGRGDSVLAGLKQLAPKRYAETPPTPQTKPKRMAKAHVPASPGFVMDYIVLSSQSDFTFESNTTYYVTSVVELDGTTTFEGGAVLKFPEDGSGLIHCLSNVVCNTTPNQPVICTSENDDSAGEIISSSSGTPAIGAGSDIFLSGSNPYYISNFIARYVHQALVVDGNTPYTEIANSQFINCGWAIPVNIHEITFRNLLFVNCAAVVIPDGGDLQIHGEHLTVDNCTDLVYDGGSTYIVNLTNSLPANIRIFLSLRLGS